MTYEDACDILIRHNQFFELYANEMYIPRGVESILGELRLAYKTIIGREFCESCSAEWIIDANRHRLKRIKDLEDLKLKHYTFPKQ